MFRVVISKRMSGKKIISGGRMEFPKKWEEGLRAGVVKVGNLVEGLLGRAEEWSSSIKSSSGSAQPLLSLEGQVPLPKLKELINISVDRVVASSVPALVDRTSAEIREGASTLAAIFRERGASVAAHVDIGGGGGSYGRAEAGVASVRCHPHRLPFEDSFFDFAVGHFANQYQGDLVKDVRELSRVTALSGEAVIVDFHPFGMFARKGTTRLRPLESTARGVEDHYKLCRSAGFRVVNVREAFIDENMRPFFVTDGEKQAFRMVKESPLLIFLFVKKGG
jgi:SAM-dependent methyltransferase